MNAKSHTPLHLLILLSICYCLFFFRMGARDLWNPDEPRYAQVAREMLESGEWVVPHLNGEVYSEKPPMYFWLIALISKPFGGVTEVTARLPSATAATLIVLLTYFLGGRMVGKREALMGAIITATSAQFFSIGRVGAIDMVLTLSILAALSAFYVGWIEKRPMLYVAGFVCLVPAALSKGPVGIALPLVIMPAFLLVEILLRKEHAKKQAAWFAAAAIIGLAIIAVFVIPWWREAHERSGGAYGSLSILVKQTRGRMFQSYSHQRPFHYYFGEILWQFLPWTVFLPFAAHAVKKRGDFRGNPGIRFLVVWFLSVFVFFTAISGKRGQYILPLIPAGGLILGWAFVSSNLGEGRLRERRAFLIPMLLLALLGAVGLGVISVGAYIHAREYFPAAAVGALACAVVLAALCRQLPDRSPRTALACVVAVTCLVVAFLFGYIGPIIDHKKSARPFCNDVLAAMEEGDGLFFYRFYRPNIHYYMDRRIPRLMSNEEVLEALRRSPRVFLVLESRREGMLDLDPAYQIERVARAKIGGRDMLSVMVRAAETPP